MPVVVYFAEIDTFLQGNVLFLLRQEKDQKKATKGALRKCAPVGIPRRIANRLPKMFRFSKGYRVQGCNILSCKRSKIGTFLDAGHQGGGRGT